MVLSGGSAQQPEPQDDEHPEIGTYLVPNGGVFDNLTSWC